MATDDKHGRGGASVALSRASTRPSVSPQQAEELAEALVAAGAAYHPTPGPVRSLTAAARRIDLTTRDGRKIISKETGGDRAIWTFVRTVPEAKFCVRFMGNALSRVQLYPGIVMDPSEPPIPVEEAVDDPEIRLPPQFAADALAELERITTGPDGMSGMMRGFGENLTATGEAWHLGRAATPEDPVIDPEVWQVFSKSNIVPGRGTDDVRLKQSPKDPGRPIAGNDLLYRIWRRDTQWPELADGSIAAVSDELEELLIYSRQFRAIGKSRNPAGILLLPSELDPPGTDQRAQAPEDENGFPTADPMDQVPIDGWSQFELSIVRSLIAPNEDDGSAASVVPHMIKGPAQYLKEVRHLLLDRMIDKEAIARMKFLIERIAHGVDLPVEVLTGMAEANHWTGWQIEDSTWKAHVEPTAQIPAVGLTAVHMRPALIQRHDIKWVRRLALGVDPSALVVRPNRAADAKTAHEAVVISDAALRGYLGFSDADAPDEDERMRRYALEKSGIGQDITAQLINALRLLPPDATNVDVHKPILIPGEIGPAAQAAAEEAVQDDTAPSSDDAAPEDGGDTIPDTDPGPADDASAAGLTAAAVLPDLGDQLALIEARLRDRLQVAASDTLNRALRTAGNRLRGSVQGDADLKGEVNGVPAEQVGLILGTARAPVVDTDQLLAGAFDDLEATWTAWVDQAEREAAGALGTAISTSVDPDTSPETDNDHQEGWTSLLLGLTAYAAARVFKTPAAALGETDATLSVPAGIIRDALSVAGGGPAGTIPTGSASQSAPGGLLTGPRWRVILTTFDIIATGWTWHTGAPLEPFHPHHDLAGLQFENWDDPVLANASGWPHVSHFYPGDHRGCQCYTTPVLVQRTRSQEVAA